MLDVKCEMMFDVVVNIVTDPFKIMATADCHNWVIGNAAIHTLIQFHTDSIKRADPFSSLTHTPQY